jgi:TatD DNase family protein
MYVDSHCHLEGSKFEADRSQVLRRAAAAGIEALLAIGNGTGPGTLDCGIRVARQEAVTGLRIFTSVGIHPHEARIAGPAEFAELERLAQHPKVIAWGEIGLDYWYDFSPRPVQQAVLVRQLELARAARKPIVIHCRCSKHDPEDAWSDLLRLLRLNWQPAGLGGIMHCFSGKAHHLQASLDLGFMISVAGNVSFPKADDIRQAARQVPLERLLLETDSPYLAPIPHRGRRNEPAYVVEVARRVAQLREVPSAAVAAATTANFYRFFGFQEWKSVV